MWKKTISLLVCICLCAGAFPAFASEAEALGLNASAYHIITGHNVSVTYSIPQSFDDAGAIGIKLEFDTNALLLQNINFASVDGVMVNGSNILDSNSSGIISASWMKNDASSFEIQSGCELVTAEFTTLKSCDSDVSVTEFLVCDGDPEGIGDIIAGIGTNAFENSWPQITNQITVSSRNYVTGLSFDPDESDLWIDYSIQLDPVVSGFDDYSDYVSLKYSSSDPSIASVSAEGLVTGLSTGEAVITAYIEGYEDSLFDEFLFNVYERPTHVVTTNSLCNGVSAVSLLEGGGVYLEGEEVTVTAHVRPGCEFLGWFASDDSNAPAITTELEYSFSVPVGPNNIDLDEEIALYAKYETSQTVNLKINGCEFKVNSASQTEHYESVVNYGETIVLEYTGSEPFIGWRNASGYYVSRNTAFTINNLLVSTELTAVIASSYAEEGVYAAFVDFVSLYDQLVAADTWFSIDTDKTMPNGPSDGIGKQFEGWSVNGIDVLDATDLVSMIDAETITIRLIPVYSAIENPVTVKYYRDGNLVFEKIVNAGTSMSFSASEIEGRYFSCWSLNGPSEEIGIASTRDSYRIKVNADISIYANYVDSEESAALNKPYVVIASVYADDENDQKYLYYDMVRDIPDGYSIIEQGALWGTSPSLFGTGDADENLRFDENTGSAKASVNRFAMSSKVNRGTATAYLTIKEQSVDIEIYLRAYVIITDGYTTQYVYSPVVYGSYNTISDAAL